MKRLNNKGFTLVELLAVIVVLAIVMGLAVVAITGVLDNARKATFVADAKSFLDGARGLVNASEMNTMLSSVSATEAAPTCTNGIGEVKIIPLCHIPLQSGGKKSPYNNDYRKTGSGETSCATITQLEKTDSNTTVNLESAPYYSYVKVESTVSDNKDCSYKYSIFLTDGVYRIGMGTNPEAADTVDTNKVELVGTE